MTNYAIQVQGLGKEYIIGGAEQRHDTFREMLTGALISPIRKLRKLRGDAQAEERFWALEDIDFEIQKGEVLGIIGHNGAGKSTLLKILSRITAPTKGKIVTCGRIASLLEVGTGFHPELTGRENIYLNGAVLGMSRKEIERKFDEIVDFSGIETFLDTPVKRYSSGMSVRLAFSVAAHLEPEIMLVDEVLAVGDAAFQKKCLGKMDSVAGEGRTVLFVSHNISAVGKLCNRGLVLASGKLAFDGDIKGAMVAYANQLNENSELRQGDFFGPLTDQLKFTGLMVNDRKVGVFLSINAADKITITAVGENSSDLEAYRTTFAIRKDGQHLVSLHDCNHPQLLAAGTFRSQVEIPAKFLSPGEYSIEIGGYSVEEGDWTWGREQGMFTVIEEWDEDYDTRANMGLINFPTCGQRTSGDLN